MGLSGVRRGKTTITTVSNPKAPCPLDKVNREFRVARPNALWVVDFTYGAPRAHMSGMLRRKEDMNECLALCCEGA
jgi:transposase InsO family protein